MTTAESPGRARPRLVAVVGATGRQGGATARALLDYGVPVRALTRRPDSPAARALAESGAEVVAADLEDVSSVRAAFAGADRVFAMATMAVPGGVAAEVRHGHAMAEAARDTGVEHLVYSSVGGAERHTGIPHFESKRRIEERIEELGLPATFLRPVFFMENLLGTTVEGGEVVVRLPLPDGIPLQMIAVGDIGRAAAAILLDPAWIGRSVEIAGDERTGGETARAFAEHARLPGRYEEVPLEALDEDRRAMFAWFARPPAYRADFDATRGLVGAPLDLAAWLAHSGWHA